MWLESRGVITYNPERSKGISSDGLCALELPNDGLSDYYRWWMSKQPNTPKLHKPTHHPHISVIRGEQLKDNIGSWGYLDGLEVRFKYLPYPKKNRKSYHQTNDCFKIYIYRY
jgi:hypothetical protein